MQNRIATTLAWITALLFAGVFAGLEFALSLPRAASAVAVPVAIGALPVLAAVVTYLIRGASSRVEALLAAATPLVLAASSLGAFVVVDGRWTRWSIGVVSAVLLALFLSYWRGLGRRDPRFRDDDFAHLSLAVHVFATFFVFAVSFGVTDYLAVPVPVAALAVFVIALVTVAETLRRSAVQSALVVPVALTLAAVMAESYVAISQLPTGNLVNALAGAVLYATVLYAMLAVLSAAHFSSKIGRQAVLAAGLVALVFSTARWS